MREDLSEGLTAFWVSLATFVPKLVAFLLILIIGLIVAKAIAKAIEKLLEKAGFDRAVERGGVKKALAKSKFDASDIVAKLVYYTLVLFVLQFAFGVFGSLVQAGVFTILTCAYISLSLGDHDDYGHGAEHGDVKDEFGAPVPAH